MVEQYLSSIVAKSDVSPKEIELTPLVKELSGVIKIPADYDYKKDYIDYLEKKYQ